MILKKSIFIAICISAPSLFSSILINKRGEAVEVTYDNLWNQSKHINHKECLGKSGKVLTINSWNSETVSGAGGGPKTLTHHEMACINDDGFLESCNHLTQKACKNVIWV
ncbi:MAG: hypothetical protein WD068_00550 [Candidatus Babeliales bacterium]